MTQISPALQARIQEQKFNQNTSNNFQYVDLTQKPDTVELSTKEEEPKKKNAGKIVAIGLAISAAVVGIILEIKKGKVPTKVQNIPTKIPNVPTKVPNVSEATEVIEKLKTLKLEEMTSDKFKQLKTDKFTGQIEGKLKNGDNVVMEYINGILTKSTRSGEVNFEKAYKIDITNGYNKIVEKTVNGTTECINLTKVQQDVEASQDKLKGLLKDNSKLSVEDFEKQTGEIKYKSKAQQREIDKMPKKFEALSQVELNQKMVECYNAGDKASLSALRAISESRKPERIKHAQLASDNLIPKEYLEKYSFLSNRDKFTRQEANALRGGYYSGRGTFSQSGVQKNGFLRGVKYLDDARKEEAKVIDKIIEKTPPLEQDCIVYRSVCGLEKDRADFVSSIKPGQIIPHKSYVSTSTTLGTEYATDKAWMGDNSMIMRIKLPKGTKGLIFSEREIALPRGTQLKVNSIDPKWGIVEAEYILPS